MPSLLKTLVNQSWTFTCWDPKQYELWGSSLDLKKYFNDKEEKLYIYIYIYIYIYNELVLKNKTNDKIKINLKNKVPSVCGPSCSLYISLALTQVDKWINFFSEQYL